jgi:GntR family transcriptional regulator of vanillate catabolism
MLLEGHFQPGERIREVPLAAELGVSRIPLRLVLERLAHEGLLEVRPTRGFVVQRFSTADIYDAIELRGLLEGFGRVEPAERIQPADTAKPTPFT